MSLDETQGTRENSLMPRRRFIRTTSLATFGTATGFTLLPYDSAEANPLLVALGRFALGIGAGIIANTIYDYLRGRRKPPASDNYRSSRQKRRSYDYLESPLPQRVSKEVVNANERLDMGGFKDTNASKVHGTDQHFLYAAKNYDTNDFLIPVFKTVSIQYSSTNTRSLACKCPVNNEIFTQSAPSYIVVMLDFPIIKALARLVDIHRNCDHEFLREALLPQEEVQRPYQLEPKQKLSSRLGENYAQNHIYNTALGRVEARYKNGYTYLAAEKRLNNEEYAEIFPAIKVRV